MLPSADGLIVTSGVNLKVLVTAAEKYHDVLAENRKMFNELQELKGSTTQSTRSLTCVYFEIM